MALTVRTLRIVASCTVFSFIKHGHGTTDFGHLKTLNYHLRSNKTEPFESLRRIEKMDVNEWDHAERIRC